MQEKLLIGFALVALLGCNRAKQPDANSEAVEDEQTAGHGGFHGPGKLCEGDKAEARIAKMQKCQSDVSAACNTQVYGSATPTKDVMCADPEKMKQVWKCVKDKYGGDREKMHADRKRMHECTKGE